MSWLRLCREATSEQPDDTSRRELAHTCTLPLRAASVLSQPSRRSAPYCCWRDRAARRGACSSQRGSAFEARGRALA